MNLSIHSKGISRSVALLEYAKLCVRMAVSRYRSAVHEVRVRLSDENGPRGGMDKRCQVQVNLRGRQPLRITQDSDDIYQAVALAARRTDRLIGRTVNRRRLHG